MTNTELIKQEIDKHVELINSISGDVYNKFQCGQMHSYDSLRAFIDKLPKETTPNIDLIQKSWYRQGYIDGINKQEPQWILKDLKYKENPKYGQPLETVIDCRQLENSEILTEEVKRLGWSESVEDCNDFHLTCGDGAATINDVFDLASHFAKWGAEHLRK